MALIHLPAIEAGAVAALWVAVPAAVAGEVLVDGEGGERSALALALTAVILAGCALGGFVAASARREAPLSHGAVAALAAYVVVQGAGVVLLAVRGEEIRVVAILFNAMLASSVGLLGAMVATRRVAS